MAKSKAKKQAKAGGKKKRKQGKSGSKNSVGLFVLVLLVLVILLAYLFVSNGSLSLWHGESAPKEKTQSAMVTKEVPKKQSVKPQTPAHSAAKKKKKVQKAKSSDRNITRSSLSSPQGQYFPLYSQTRSDLRDIYYEDAAVPELEYAYASQRINHMGYGVSYNAEFKVPNWVFYELTRGELNGDNKRKNNFAPDPAVPVTQMAQLSDYRNSGYDRGHMAPAADFSWSETAMEESFYLSNICPQGHDFNAGIWLTLEDKVREWAQRDSAICVVTGPILPKGPKPAGMKTIGKNKVLVPQRFYKVILAPFGQKPKAIGFIMENHDSRKSLSTFAVSVDSVERVVGMDFFSVLPDDVEKSVEKNFSLKEWF